MRKFLGRLGGSVVLLCGLTANSSPPLPEGSAVIVHTERLISADKIDGTQPDGISDPITLWSYDADFTVTNQLGGPDLGKRARISFIDQRQSRPEKLFMIVHRDGRGRLWARRAWQEVDSQLCLSARQVSNLGLDAAFASARDNSEGQRCIGV